MAYFSIDRLGRMEGATCVEAKRQIKRLLSVVSSLKSQDELSEITKIDSTQTARITKRSSRSFEHLLI